MSWLKHAFAVDPPGPAMPGPEATPVIERACREIVRRRLTIPAILWLEMSRPLNYIGAQAILFFLPIVSLVADTQGVKHFANFLEKRGSIDYIHGVLERLQTEADHPTSQIERGIDTHE